jgi:hypothetical protein
MQKKINWTLIISVISLAAVLSLAYMVTTIDVPTASEIAEQIPPVVIPIPPTAQEIADLIKVPDSKETHLSVRSEKIKIAEDLIEEEMQDRDFKEDVAELLTDECDDIDVERRDITDMKIKETDYSWFSENWPVNDEDGTVIHEIKIYFDNDGDSDEAGKALIEASFYVTDLDYDDDYEDAEVDSYDLDFIKAYGDLEC